jgi:hypothetical protein
MKSLTLLFLLLAFQSFGQFEAPPKVNNTTRFFDRKFVAGIAVNNSWSSYRDLQDDSAFYKPSLGIGLRAEYYIIPSVGISVGAGTQGRGMGVFTPDLDDTWGIGNEDSTGRLRYRTQTWDFPVQLVLRTPKDVFRSARISLMLGANFSFIQRAHRIWRSVDDGFHEWTDITERYEKMDIPLRAGLGLDYEVGLGCLFRLNLYGEMGSKYLYTDPTTGTKGGQNALFGIDLSFLF